MKKNNIFNSDLYIKPPKMVDGFAEYKTKNILLGNYNDLPTDYAKKITIAVIKAYSKDNITNKIQTNAWADFFDELFKQKPDYNYNYLIKILKTTMETNENNNDVNPSFEYVMAAVMFAYSNHDRRIITRLLNTFGRPLKLDDKKGWLDNYRLNGPGHALNFIFWNEYDADEVVTYMEKLDSTDKVVTYKNIDINVEELITPRMIEERFGKNLFVSKIVGYFRCFLIVNHLLPNADYNITDADSVVNVCYKYFPIYYLGSFGCGWFNDKIAPSIETIKSFLEKYPRAYIVAIVNSAYGDSEGDGQHWMGIAFNKKNNENCCVLLGPTADTWQIFHDRGTLVPHIVKCGFVQIHNTICCQRDNCNCGVYSFLFIYEYILNKGDLEAAINAVGLDAENLNKNNNDRSINNKTKMIYRIKDILFGTK